MNVKASATMKKPPIATEQDLIALLRPETDLELRLIADPQMQRGLRWGEPRYGHPEGKVVYHIPEVYANIDRVTPHLSKQDREFLRIVALSHDSFKFVEHKGSPRDWLRHHSMLARKFMENYTDNQHLLDIIELHDEAYYAWRHEVLDQNLAAATERLTHLFRRVRPVLQLYYTFFKCDTLTGDKTLAPVRWFEKRVKEIDIITI
jgi:hypothetical protein